MNRRQPFAIVKPPKLPFSILKTVCHSERSGTPFQCVIPSEVEESLNVAQRQDSYRPEGTRARNDTLKQHTTSFLV